MRFRPIFLTLAALLPACASAPPAPPAPSGTLLGYAPGAAQAQYSFVDSSAFEIQGGAIGEIRATTNATGTADIVLAPSGAYLAATIRITDLAGSFTNSIAGSGPAATEADIEGPAVLTVTARGAATVDSMPKVGNSAQRIGVNQSFFRRFIVRLPARQVSAGASWVDTVTALEDAAGTRISVRDVITSTFLRDSVAGERTLAVISTATQRTLDVSGVSDGVEISQKLTGSGTGTVLWDTGRNLLVLRSERSELSGTFDLPQMGISGLPVTARGIGQLVLR